IGENVMIGMNSVIMDEVIIGKDSIVGALTFIKAKEIIPERSLVVGNPGKIVKTLTDDVINWKKEGTKLYQKLPLQCQETLKECIPLSTEPEEYAKKEYHYAYFKK